MLLIHIPHTQPDLLDHLLKKIRFATGIVATHAVNDLTVPIQQTPKNDLLAFLLFLLLGLYVLCIIRLKKDKKKHTFFEKDFYQTYILLILKRLKNVNIYHKRKPSFKKKGNIPAVGLMLMEATAVGDCPLTGNGDVSYLTINFLTAVW